MTGFTREELLSMKPLDLTDDEGKARFTERMRLRLADEEVSDAFEMRIRTKGGAYLDMLICPGDFIYADGMRTGALVIAHDITEFKRIEKELRKKENHLRSIIQYAPTGIYEIDYSTGRFIDVNDVMSDMLGYSREEYLAMAVSDILDEADKPLYAARMSDVNAGKELEKCLEYRLRAKDGRLFWVIINLTYRWKDGKIVGATGVATDISGRKLIENELLALNRRLRTLMDCAPVGISFSSDATCEHIRGNAAMLAQFEMSPRENVSASAPDGDAAGRKVKYYKDGRELSDADLPLQRAVAENRAIPSKDLEIVLPSGRRWFADAFGAPILDSNGVVVGGVAVTVDITQRKLAEQALAETSQKLAEVISSIQDEFFVLDRNWIFVYVNRKFTLKFGKEPMDFLGNNVWKILPRHRGTPIEENLRATMEKREVRRFEIQGVYTDAWFRITSFPSAEGITVIGTDITERKRTEEELGKRMNELAATNEELARFNSAMVHRELRMVELKKQVNELSRRLGEPPVYNLENP
jgi:PAS domain S-box-containing protein